MLVRSTQAIQLDGNRSHRLSGTLAVLRSNGFSLWNATHNPVFGLIKHGRGWSTHTDNRHLCAWGNVAVNEVKPRRDYCWLKTISKPPLVGLSAGEFLDGGPSRGVSLQHKHITTKTKTNINYIPLNPFAKVAPDSSQDGALQLLVFDR